MELGVVISSQEKLGLGDMYWELLSQRWYPEAWELECESVAKSVQLTPESKESQY